MLSRLSLGKTGYDRIESGPPRSKQGKTERRRRREQRKEYSLGCSPSREGKMHVTVRGCCLVLRLRLCHFLRRLIPRFHQTILGCCTTRGDQSGDPLASSNECASRTRFHPTHRRLVLNPSRPPLPSAVSETHNSSGSIEGM